MADTSDHPQDVQIKRRVSKACDNCRVLKSRCERETTDQDCRRCESEGLECTSDAPVKRRGPAKGYVQLVETRVHELEAVMGVLLSNPHPAVRNMFVTLTQDPFANEVLTQVANGAFGPRALARYATEHDAGRASTSSNGQTPQGPTNDWQLQTVRTIVAQTHQSLEYNQPTFGSGLESRSSYNESHESTASHSSMSPMDDSLLEPLGDPFKGWDSNFFLRPKPDQ